MPLDKRAGYALTLIALRAVSARAGIQTGSGPCYELYAAHPEFKEVWDIGFETWKGGCLQGVDPQNIYDDGRKRFIDACVEHNQPTVDHHFFSAETVRA